MSDPSSPLLGPSGNLRPSSKRSNKSNSSAQSAENTPLLSRVDGDDSQDQLYGSTPSPARSSLQTLSDENSEKRKPRWPTIIALCILILVIIGVMIAAFFAPAVVEEYAKEAIVFDPTKLSIDSFTSDGVRARVQGDFRMDASRVDKEFIRNLGRFGTWIAAKVQTAPTDVEVSLPEYGGILLGTAAIPTIVVSIRNGETTHVNFTTDIKPGDVKGIRTVANDWVEGRLGQLRIQAATNVGLKSGIFPLGTQSLKESLVFKGHDLPSIPKYRISKLRVHEQSIPRTDDKKTIVVDASIDVANKYPVQLDIPSLAFDVLVPNCMPSDPTIEVGNASTLPLQIRPYKNVTVNAKGLLTKLPKALTSACPNSLSSPLDNLLGDYMKGENTTIFIQGSKAGTADAPKWISDLLASIKVPLPFSGHPFDHLIKKFSFDDVHFSLPDPLAKPDSPESRPQISAKIEAFVSLPNGIDVSLNVSQVRAKADVFYSSDKLGELDLQQWQPANSSRSTDKDGQPLLKIISKVTNAPLDITNNSVFSDVIQAMLFGGKGVVLETKADVDVKVKSALGDLVVRKIPAEGEVAIAPLPGSKPGSFAPKVEKLEITNTTKDSLTLRGQLKLTNPTNYSAVVPYLNVHIVCNETTLGEATAKHVSIKPGVNEEILIESIWYPRKYGGKSGAAIGRELLSQYISGWNTSLTIKSHRGTIPSQPALGKALAAFPIEIPTPQLRKPGSGGSNSSEPHFIEDATMHVFSSTATFVVVSPLQKSTLHITRINATAFYQHTEPVGVILYDQPFAVPPGSITTPDLPVDWSLSGVGFDAIKNALGGTLKLDTFAYVGLRLDNWEDEIWHEGHGIGAKIRF